VTNLLLRRTLNSGADVVAVKTLTVDLRSSELVWGSVIFEICWGEVVGQVWRKEELRGWFHLGGVNLHISFFSYSWSTFLSGLKCWTSKPMSVLSSGSPQRGEISLRIAVETLII
jgi:hypothetical protein